MSYLRRPLVRKSVSQGFTLIEILVVIVILAVVTSMTTIGFGRSTQQQLQTTADNADVWLQALATEALLTSSTLGLWVDGQILEPLAWDGENWQRLLEPEAFAIKPPVSLIYEATVKHEKDVLAPDHVFLPTGQTLPPITFVLDNGEKQITLQWPPDKTEQGAQ